MVVMLTRLNENGLPMCHCYWPTNVGQLEASGQPADDANGAARPLLGAAGLQPQTPASPPSGRRGSVTSVFSTTALVGGLARQANGSLASANGPVVANGEPSDNVLYFDVPSDDTDAKLATRPATFKLEVHLISEHVSSTDYIVRNMYLINRSTGETRTISQFHYIAWPDGKTPDNVRSLLQFRRKVHKSYRNLKSPILVHCNDGAGRSGTYTLLDIILERIKNGAKEIDARATLEHLRDQRIGLCATQSQFEFVLVALAEEIQIILNALPK